MTNWSLCLGVQIGPRQTALALVGQPNDELEYAVHAPEAMQIQDTGYPEPFHPADDPLKEALADQIPPGTAKYAADAKIIPEI